MLFLAPTGGTSRWLAAAALLISLGLLSSRAVPPPLAAAVVEPGGEISLDGTWETGVDRHYDGQTPVPGLAEDPTKLSPGTLWYRRVVHLPAGPWTAAVLQLNGARFAPAVYVDGEKVGEREGGMAPIRVRLRGAAVVPGGTFLLEIALQSLKDVAARDASVVPVPDRFRSDISSELWDTVTVHFSGDSRILRVTPWTEFAADRVSVHWEIEGSGGATVEAAVLDAAGRVLVESAPNAGGVLGIAELALHGACQPWTPDSPRTYRLRVALRRAGQLEDVREFTWGLRDFRTEGLRFVLNGEPVQLRGGSLVWHRWLRDPEARRLAFDPAWFEQNIVLRLKGLGANLLRFHLGLPPESFLDLCDRDGLMVQMEWPFFHGVKASPESMRLQWRDWLDVALRHPSVVLIHPWNETEGDELKAAWAAMNAVLTDYPRLVVAQRDTLHIHKYWWSLFENLGLYYDSAAQFDRPIMVDEFGGNYLDYQGNAGPYPAVRESLLRFLGRDQTPAMRLEFQAEANARVAEYWRRLGAAGIAPFVMASSPEDGNTWFLGELAHPQPKPVWEALAAAFSPMSASLDVWDRNFLPGQTVTLPVVFFNDTGQSRPLKVSVRVAADDSGAETMSERTLTQAVPAHDQRRIEVPLTLPQKAGNWRFEARLETPVPGVTHPVVSSWAVRTLAVETPAALTGVALGVLSDEPEIRTLLRQNGLKVTEPDDASARVLVGSAATWRRLTQTPALRRQWYQALGKGKSIVLLDVGPRDLGQGYKSGDLGPLEGAPRLATEHIEQFELLPGIQVSFALDAEPESHLQSAPSDDSLWAPLPRPATWLWNGLRGGLIVPAEDMEVTGLSPSAFFSLWTSRGADAGAMKGSGGYYAYQLAGYYAFSAQPKDTAVIGRLRDQVKAMAEDAPSLESVINPKAPVTTIDLSRAYQRETTGEAEALTALASAGKNLTRIPIVELGFGRNKGRVLLSQVLTAGRLVRGAAEPGPYGIRYDPAAEQFTLNMIARVLAHEK